MYDRYYYEHGCGTPYERNDTWLRFFGHIAERIIADIAPRTVFDAGCAMGFLVEALRDRGIEAFGVDISEHAIDHVRPDVKPFCRLGTLVTPLAQDYDLITCIEVLEHLPADQAEQALVNLCGHTRDLLFSSTPEDFAEPTHLNVRPPEYWGERFAQQGFYRDVDFDAAFISPWAVRFRKRSDPVARALGDYERLVFRLRAENRTLKQALAEQHEKLRRNENSERHAPVTG